jgi:Predicted pPIWI-associating nuclease
MPDDPEKEAVQQVDVAKLAHSMIELAPNAFTREAMLGAALVLEQRQNPLRLNLFAVAIRIFLDHVMDALAPQAAVEACLWFKPVEGQEKPVRNARLTYALIGGFTEMQVEELTGIEVKPLVKEVIAAYSEVNKHVHGRDDTIVRDLDEQDSVADEVLGSLAELLEAQRDYRSEIVDGIADSLQSEAVVKFTTETVDEIDILATHHTVDWVGIDERSVIGITASHVEYEVTGSVGVTLLYGSGSDRQNGDGAELSEEFPISMRFRVPVETPHDLEQAEITSEIDTSAWFDNGDEEDDET